MKRLFIVICIFISSCIFFIVIYDFMTKYMHEASNAKMKLKETEFKLSQNRDSLFLLSKKYDKLLLDFKKLEGDKTIELIQKRKQLASMQEATKYLNMCNSKWEYCLMNH